MKGFFLLVRRGRNQGCHAVDRFGRWSGALRTCSPGCHCHQPHPAPTSPPQVVEQGPGQYFCEYDGTTLASMVRRYIFNARVMDESGEANIQVFNDQVRPWCSLCLFVACLLVCVVGRQVLWLGWVG